MSSVFLFISVALMLQVSSACDGQNEQAEQLTASRQLQSDEYFANAFGYTPETWNALSYQPSNPYYTPEYSSLYEGRTSLNNPQPINGNSFNKYFANSNNVEDEKNQAENRLLLGGLGVNLINTGLFNNRFTPANTWRPFTNLANRFPITINPNFNNPVNTFDACKSPSGEEGICVPGNVCSLFGGRPSGSCILGKVCCINAITTCGGTVTLNNTYWQSPTTAVSAPSTCALTVKMDTKLIEQSKRPICQVRLDFVAFTTAQPTLGTCTDTFVVGGSISTSPIICGDNTGQHMYLDIPSSAITPTDIQLMFNFAAATTTTRSWNIKIAMLPCGASYLAPTDCLQYFTAASGRVKSFNWQDVATTTTRQLNNQKYNICFRTELVSGSRATEMCVSACTTTTPFVGFFLTGTGQAAAPAQGAAPAVPAAAAASATGTGANTGCTYDFLAIVGGFDPVTGVINDRYCGGSLPTTSVCTKMRPFKMNYGTDDTEAAIAAAVPPTQPVAQVADTANTGFCLDYQEK